MTPHSEKSDHSQEERPLRLSDFTRLGTGALPVPIVPWSLIRQRRRQLAGRAQKHDKFKTIALMIVLSGMFMVNLSVTLIAVAVPTIADEFNAADSTIVWAVTGPILAAAVFGPTFGKLGDQGGHRRMLIGGLAVNAFFTLAVAASWGAIPFVALRVLGAIGGAALGPSALAFLNNIYSPEERAGALGWWSFVGAGSPVLGVVLGAFAIDTIGWRWVFVIQAPLVLLAMALVALLLPDTRKQADVSFDYPGAATLGAGMGLLLLGVTFAGGEASAFTVGSFFVGAALSLALFAVIESKSPAPLLPPRYWTTRGFIFPTLTMALMFAAYMGSFVLTPLMLQSTAFGYTAARTGLVTIARPAMFSLTGPSAGWFSERFGQKSLAMAGAGFVALSMALLSRFTPDQTIWYVAVALGIAGVGAGMVSPALTAAVANSVEDEDLGVAGAAQQMLQQVGLVVGIQALQAVQAAAEPNGEIASYQTAFTVATVIAIAGLATASFVPNAKQAY